MLDLETMEQLMSSEEWRKFQKEPEHCREDWGPEEGGRAPNLAPRCADMSSLSQEQFSIRGKSQDPVLRSQDPFLNRWQPKSLRTQF